MAVGERCVGGYFPDLASPPLCRSVTRSDKLAAGRAVNGSRRDAVRPRGTRALGLPRLASVIRDPLDLGQCDESGTTGKTTGGTSASRACVTRSPLGTLLRAVVLLIAVLHALAPCDGQFAFDLFGGATGENSGVTPIRKIDCSGLCSRYLQEADEMSNALSLDGNDTEAASGLCDAMHRLVTCLSTVDFTAASNGGSADPQHANCELNFGMLFAKDWALDVLSTECKDAPPPVDTTCNVSATCPGGGGGHRRTLPRACSRRALGVCQLFGDRHLISGEGVLETCLLPGVWPLVQFDGVSVYASNTPHLKEPLRHHLYPLLTETSKLQMVQVALMMPDHTYLRYNASANSPYLEPYFVLGDGQHVSEVQLASNGRGSEPRVAHIWADSENGLRTVEITLPWLCTVVVLRLFGYSLTVTVAMPRDMADVVRRSGTQLCRDGCSAPRTGLVARYEWTGRRKRCRRDDEENNGGRLVEEFAERERRLNLSTSAQAQHECMNILRKLGPSIYLSACRWDIALRASRPKEVRRQFACSAEFAAHDSACLTRIGGEGGTACGDGDDGGGGVGATQPSLTGMGTKSGSAAGNAVAELQGTASEVTTSSSSSSVMASSSPAAALADARAIATVLLATAALRRWVCA